jgi:hypothetical protein
MRGSRADAPLPAEPLALIRLSAAGYIAASGAQARENTGRSTLAQQHVTDALRPEDASGVLVVMEQIAVDFEPDEFALQWRTDCRENRFYRFHLISCGVTPFSLIAARPGNGGKGEGVIVI